MSQDLLTGRTGVAWAPNFATYDVGPTAAFIPSRPFLPNAPWDIGQRVQCLRDILDHSGFSQYVSWVQFEPATLAMIESFHSHDYIQSVMTRSQGDETGAYDAALLGVGAVTQLVRDVFDRKLSNGYALVRPVGHHADRERAGGGCVFANGVFAAMEARQRGAQRILYVDWDAHHGNSQQGAFWKDRDVLTISIHQAQKVPPLTSGLDARGEQEGFGFNINIPVPAGSGTSVYKRAFEDVIQVAAERFHPDFVIVSSGLDGNNIDPSSRLRLHSEDYFEMASKLVKIAKHYANGRIVMTHEGGYALAYIPICFLRIVEAMSGLSAGIDDPFLSHWRARAGGDLADEANAEAVEIVHAAAALAREIPRP